MPRPGNCPLDIYVGDTYSNQLTFTDTDNAPLNLSGNTYLAQIRKSPGASSVLATFTVTTTNAATGVLVISLTSTVTAALPSGLCTWDLEQTAGATVTTLVAGDVTVTADVSRGA